MSEKQSKAQKGKKRGPYKNDGTKCTIPSHNHNPRDCPGRARIKCAICGKSLISHKPYDYCRSGDGTSEYVLDELGMRRRNKT